MSTQRKPRIYIAGPMQGKPLYNFPLFDEVAEQFRKFSIYDPVNPADLDRQAGFDPAKGDVVTPEFLEQARKRDLDALLSCEAIAMLPDWEKSKGARAEYAVAVWAGLDVCLLEQIHGGFSPTWLDGRKLAVTPLEQTPNPADPKGAAGAKKCPLWLIPTHPMEEVAWVHKLGADKYGPFNWRENKVCASTYISAIMRHLNQWRDGKDLDPESNRSHLAHIATSCNIVMDAMHRGTLIDDRA